jgi:hypothetical protein
MTEVHNGLNSRSSRAESEGCMSSRPPKPVCKLIGTDGNVFSIIGRVRKALRESGQEGRAREFVERAYRSGSYEEVLQLCMEYVEVV